MIWILSIVFNLCFHICRHWWRRTKHKHFEHWNWRSPWNCLGIRRDTVLNLPEKCLLKNWYWDRQWGWFSGFHFARNPEFCAASLTQSRPSFENYGYTPDIFYQWISQHYRSEQTGIKKRLVESTKTSRGRDSSTPLLVFGDLSCISC